MKHTPPQRRIGWLVLVLMAMLLFSACRPDDTLDITPSPTPTPEPSPTPTPTPLPEGFEERGNPNELALEALIELLPNSLPAGEVQWNRDTSRGDNGLGRIRGIRGTAEAKRIYFRTQEGGLMHLDFAVFDTAEEARANYDRILGIRSTLETGKPKDNFPQPNIFGSGLYGSVAIFQIDNYFIEVFIEIFTRGNPLEPLSRETIRFFENNRSVFEAAASEDSAAASLSAVLDSALANMPNEIITNTQWRRDFSRFEGVDTPPNVQNGTAFRVFYMDQTANAFNMTFGHFDSVADSLAHYEKIKGIREGIEAENTIEDFPQPHVLGRGLYGSVAIFAIDEFFLEVLVERAPGTSANPTEAIARRALSLLEEARAE